MSQGNLHSQQGYCLQTAYNTSCWKLFFHMLKKEKRHYVYPILFYFNEKHMESPMENSFSKMICRLAVVAAALFAAFHIFVNNKLDKDNL